MSLAVLLFVSTVAGLVGAMAGMGGGVVLIPVLTFFGLDIKQAIAISIVSVIATSSGSASAYVRDHITNLKIGMFLEMFTIVGALVGASIAVAASSGPVPPVRWRSPRVVDRPVVPAPGGVAADAGRTACSRWLELDGGTTTARSASASSTVARASLGGPLMFGAGLIAGLLGIGAGALKVLIHDLVMGLPPKVSTTTSNLIIGVTALAGTSVYLPRA